MKPNCKRTLSKLLILGLTAATVLAPATTDTASAAAKKVKLSKKSVSVKVKGKATITVKNAGKKKIKAKMVNKKIATVKVSKKKLTITGKKAGKTKLTVTVKGMKKCKITVTVKKASKKKTENKKSTGTPSPNAKQATATPTPAVSNSPEKKVTKLEWIRDLIDKTGIQVLTETELAMANKSGDFYSFQDIKATKDKLIVETAVRKGIIADTEVEKSNKKFNPDENIEKEYIYTTAIRLLGYRTEDTNVSTEELEQSSDYSKYVQIAIDIGLAKADSKGKYNVHDSISKKEEEQILSFVKERYDLQYGEVKPEDNSVLADQFNEDAVDTDVNYTISETGSDYFVTLPSDDVKDLKVDDSFYLPPSDQCPDGISLIAKEIVQDGDTTNIKASKVTSVEQIYEKVDIQDNYEITEENFTPAEGVDIVEAQEETSNSEDVQKLDTNSEDGSSDINLEVSGEASVTIGKPRLIVSLEMDGAELESVSVRVVQTTQLNAKVSGTAGINKKIGEITVSILETAGVRAHFVLTLIVNAEGEASVEAKLTTEAGIEFRDNKLAPITKCAYTSDLKLEINCKALLKFSVELRALEYRVFGIKISDGFIVIDAGIEGGIGLQAWMKNRTEAEIGTSGISAKSVTCKERKWYKILTIFVGDNDDSLFRDVYDSITHKKERVELNIWNVDVDSATISDEHWEKVNDGEWEEKDKCVFGDDEMDPSETPAPTFGPANPTPTPTCGPEGPTPTPTGTCDDEKVLKAIIAEQRSRGATVSEDIHNPEEYTWEGNKLVAIKWCLMNRLKGDLDLSCFDNLTCFTISDYWFSEDEPEPESTQINSLNVSGCKNLETISLDKTQINSLNASGCENLVNLYLPDTQIGSLNMSNCVNFHMFIPHDTTQISSLDVSGCENLVSLSYSDQKSTSLNVSGCENLEILHCENNQISSLDVSDCVNLNDLTCSDNQISSLDVSDCVNLVFLHCENNQISSLDVSNCVNLVYLYCENNQISSLDMSDCVNLVFFHCENNQISSLDLSNCERLRKFNLTCDDNVNVYFYWD